MGSIDKGRWRSATGGVKGLAKGIVTSIPGLNKHDANPINVNIIPTTAQALLPLILCIVNKNKFVVKSYLNK